MYPQTIINLIECYKKLPGIGEKTALKLLQDYGSLDGVYENIDSIHYLFIPCALSFDGARAPAF